MSAEGSHDAGDDDDRPPVMVPDALRKDCRERQLMRDDGCARR